MTKPDLVEPAGAKPYAAPALDKGLDILELLCSLEQPLNQREIAKRLDRSVGEIYRMLACLVDRQYVSLIDDNYYLTMKLFELANRNPPTQRLLVEARPIMQYLATTLDQSCHLTVYGQGKQVVIAKVDMPTAMGFSVRVGAELDLVVSASGRVLVAFQDKGTQALRLEEAGRRAPGLNYPDLAATLKAIHERGYESAPGVQLKGLHAISYPVLDTQGHAIAAITVPYAERIDQRNHTSIPQVEQALGKAARQLSALIGGKVQG